MNAFNDSREHYRTRLETALDQRLPAENSGSGRLNQALRYCSLNGGKRLRAMLVYAAGTHFGVSETVLDVPACAVELIHAYSLVHDDLPCMDDDTLRRGRATCHIEFDEATALLAGDAAQTLAFELLASDPALDVPDSQRLAMVRVLAQAAGINGMAGGQSLDMEATDCALSLPQLKKMHSLKTGALIKGSCLLGGYTCAGISQEQLSLLATYGEALGLAFQVMDDILDVTADTETLGKVAGADQAMHKSTYVALLGLDAARETCQDLCAQAVESARLLGDNQGMLEKLAQFAGSRSY